jgi:peptide/nickel transport system permease protein
VLHRLRRRRRDPEIPAADAPAARSYSTLVWRRLRRDRLAIVSGCVLVAILAVSFLGEPIASRLLGHGPNDLFPFAADINK